jgi:hypothetical protein
MYLNNKIGKRERERVTFDTFYASNVAEEEDDDEKCWSKFIY